MQRMHWTRQKKRRSTPSFTNKRFTMPKQQQGVRLLRWKFQEDTQVLGRRITAISFW